jgi:hypothetical protein
MQLLILGTLPGPRRRAALLRGDAYRVVSTSRWLSAQLRAVGIQHRDAASYAPTDTWPAVHAAAAQRLRRLRRRAGATVDARWLDDWSHLLVDEVREQIFWELVARGIVARDRPRGAYAQQLAPTAAPYAAVTALTDALVALGVPSSPW